MRFLSTLSRYIYQVFVINSPLINKSTQFSMIWRSCNYVFITLKKKIIHVNTYSAFLRSWTSAMDQMELKPFAAETGLEHLTINTEWDVTSFRAERKTIKYQCCKKPFSEVIYHLHLRRKTLYYMYTLIVPVATITSLIAVGFCLPPNSGERIILSVTILVSMTVYLNIASKRLPATSDNIPLLSLFYFLLFVQISFSLAASTFVLANFYRQNFSKPMPAWFKWLVFENLSRLLCGFKLQKRPPINVRAKQRRKMVRFSDIITINGSATSITSSKDGASPANGSVNSVTRKESDTKGLADKEKLSKISSTNSESTKIEQPVMNGSAKTDSLVTTDLIHLYENKLEETIAEELEKQHTHQLLNDEMEVLTNDVCQKEKKKATILEWQYASIIIDRAFLIVFIFTLTVSLSFFLLHNLPHLTDEHL